MSRRVEVERHEVEREAGVRHVLAEAAILGARVLHVVQVPFGRSGEDVVQVAADARRATPDAGFREYEDGHLLERVLLAEDVSSPPDRRPDHGNGGWLLFPAPRDGPGAEAGFPPGVFPRRWS